MLIDWDRLTELRTDIGEEDFADVAFLFVSEISEHLNGLVADPSAARAADFHCLRGSAANLGFVALAAMCDTAEKAAKSGHIPDVSAISSCFSQSLASAAEKVPELTAA